MLPGLREQTQHSEPHQEPVRRWSVARSGRDQQGLAVLTGQRPQMRSQRRHESLQTGEGDRRLRLETAELNGDEPAGGQRVLQQCRLAHAGVAADHQGPTDPVASVADHAGQPATRLFWPRRSLGLFPLGTAPAPRSVLLGRRWCAGPETDRGSISGQRVVT